MITTHLVKKIDKYLGIVSLEVPSDLHAGSTTQERPNSCETFTRSNLNRVDLGPEARV